MKPAPFTYHAPETLEEALALLNDYGYDAKVLAGGQSLVPTMNFRLSQPAVLVDINRIAALSTIDTVNGAASGVRIGATVRQSAVERSPLVAERLPLITETMPYIAHRQIRNRGTFGGSLAHADPAAELPAVLVALGGRVCAASTRGERWIDADDFYIDLFTTALAPDELLIAAELSALPKRSGWAMEELARRHGDYAMAGVAVALTIDETQHCTRARIVFLSVGDGPVQARRAQSLLEGEHLTAELLDEAARVAAADDIEPDGDIHATADYRRHLAGVLSRRALHRAASRCGAH